MLILALTFSAANAQTWTEEATGVLVARPGTITANGVGSPTVVWDPAAERYVMFFESRTGAATADCAGGLWSIGVASSEDGLSWEVWPTAVVSPTAGTPWRCVAAHPTAVYDAGTWHLWFKAEQGLNACAAGDNAWGCDNYSGIAHATLAVELDDKTAEIASVEAEIDLAIAERDAAMDSLAAALAAYEDDLVAGQGELACAEPPAPGVCAPCDTFQVLAPETGADTQPLCQQLSFAIPNEVGVTSNSAGHVVTLSFTTTAGAAVRCEYRKNGGIYLLDANPAGGRAARCLVPNQALVAGSVVSTATGVTIAIDQGPSTPDAWVTLTATNLASQTFDGALLDTLDALEAAVAADDLDGTLALLDGFEAELQALVDWYDPADLEQAALAADAQALADQAGQLAVDLPAWEAELAALDAELDELVAYQQHVAVVSLQSQVGVQINEVFGYPAAMKKGSTWVLMYQDYPNVWRATSASPDGPFVVDAAPAMSAGTVSWAATEVFDPNLMCSGDPVFRYQAYFGGRTVTGGTFTSGGISDGLSQDTATWLLNTASQYFGWADVNEYRHFDVVRSSDGQYRMWYTSKVGGLVQVNVASTTAAFDHALTTQRVCP